MSFDKRPTYVKLQNTALNVDEAIRFLDPFWEGESSLYTCIATDFEVMYLCENAGLLVTFNEKNPDMVKNADRIYMTHEEALKLQKRMTELEVLWARSQKPA